MDSIFAVGLPEIVLLATICALFLLGPFLVSDAGEAPAGLRHRWGVISLFALVIAWLLWFKGGIQPADGGMFHIDSLVWYTRGLSLSHHADEMRVLWRSHGSCEFVLI